MYILYFLYICVHEVTSQTSMTWKSLPYWHLVLPHFFFERVATRLPRLDAANCKTPGPVWTSRSSSRWGWGPELRTCSSKCKSIANGRLQMHAKHLHTARGGGFFFLLVVRVLFWSCDISLPLSGIHGEFIHLLHIGLALAYHRPASEL